MKHILTPLFTLGLFFNLLSSPLFAQSSDPATLFGDVTPEMFTPTVYSIDSNAYAIYFFDRAEVNFDPSYNGGHIYSTIYERHCRLRILNANGLGLATMGLSTVRRSGYEAYIDDLRGSVYNMEDGHMVVTKLDKSGIFKDKTGHFNVEKVAFPNVKVGSIIDFSYRIIYPSYGFIPNWDFQGPYPVLWSQFEISIPTLFDFFVKTQGYRRFTVDTTMYSSTSFPIGFGVVHGIWSGPVVHRIWALQNAAPMEKKEIYTTTLQNHVQKVQFQLSSVKMEGYTKTYNSNWGELTQQLLRSENFGDALGDRNHWMDEILSKIAPKGVTTPENARKLYAFVRDQFTYTNQEGLYLSQPVKKTWEEKKGNVADLNLLLVAVLRHQGFDVSPVILSTRAHGFPIAGFPLLNDYNYVIASVRVDGSEYLLDATHPMAGFGQLPDFCYNGEAHAIDSSHAVYSLLPDSVTERRTTIVTLGNTDTGYTGTYHRTMGVFESMTERQRLKKQKPEDFFDNLRKTMAAYKQMQDHGFDSLDSIGEPLGMHYDMSYRFTQKTLYFNPILHERMNNNPLANPERHYPVEMPYRIDNNYVLRMEIPKGYTIAQLPKSVKYTLEDGSGEYEYAIQTEGDVIHFHMRLQLRRANYALEEYKGLRDFYSLIVEKEKEQIIFSKSN